MSFYENFVLNIETVVIFVLRRMGERNEEYIKTLNATHDSFWRILIKYDMKREHDAVEHISMKNFEWFRSTNVSGKFFSGFYLTPLGFKAFKLSKFDLKTSQNF